MFWENQPCITDKKKLIISRSIKSKLEPSEIPSLPSILRPVELFDSDLEEISSVLKLDINYVKYLLTENYLLVGLRLDQSQNNTLVGVFGVSVNNMQVGPKVQQMAVSKILFLEKKIHKKKYTPSMFQFMINLCISKNINTGFIVSNRSVNVTPVCDELKLFYRPLNYEKLYKLDFIKNQEQDQEKFINKFKITNKISSRTVKMTSDHFETCFNLYNKYMRQFNVHYKLTLHEFIKYFNNTDMVSTYVILENDKPVDFFSFVKYNKTPDIVCARLTAYTSTSLEYSVIKVLKHVVITSFNEGCDLLELYNNLESNTVLTEPDSCFSKVEDLYLYLYNWELPVSFVNQLGFI